MLRNAFISLVLVALFWTATPAATAASAAPRAKPHLHPGHPAHARSAGHASAAHPHHSAKSSHTRVSAARHPASRGATHVPQHRNAPPAPAIHHGQPEPSPPTPTAEAVSLHRTRRVAPLPPPLRGSAESLARQNEITESEGLQRILDEDDLESRIEQKLLVPISTSPSLAINGNLSETHRYCRPWTARFLADFSRAHAARFGRPLMVTSAVRTVEYQKELILTNGNAAAAEGDVVSPHLTGATIDIAKRGMSRKELGWVRSWLLSLQRAGKIDVEEEFQQACFHITVYRSYVPPPAPPRPHRHTRPVEEIDLASRGR